MAAAYSELPGKCLLVLQSASCGQAEGSGSGGGEVEVVDSRQVGLGEEGYLPAGAAVLRAGGLARTYSSISLAGFTLLSAGSTSEAPPAPGSPPTHHSPLQAPSRWPCPRCRPTAAPWSSRASPSPTTTSGPPCPTSSSPAGDTGVKHDDDDYDNNDDDRSDALNIVGLIALVLVLSQLPRLSSLLSLAPTVKRSENTEHR